MCFVNKRSHSNIIQEFGYVSTEFHLHLIAHKWTWYFHITKTVVLCPCECIKSSKEWSLFQILWRLLGWSFWRGRIQGQQVRFPVSLLHYLNRLAEGGVRVCGMFKFSAAVVGEKIFVSRWSASFSWQEDTNPKRSPWLACVTCVHSRGLYCANSADKSYGF